MGQRLVTRSAPEWVWDLIDETLAMDTQSKAFDQHLRTRIGASILAMQLACEASEYDVDKIDRSDLMLLPEWSDLEIDTSGNPIVWRNSFWIGPEDPVHQELWESLDDAQ